MKLTTLATITIALAGCGDDTSTTSTGMASVRIAHLSPDAPAVDVCLAPHGTTTWTGPVLAHAGVASGLAYGSVTAYVDVEARQYDARIVAPGSSSCATPLVPDVTDLPELPDGSHVTIAAEGLLAGGDAPFALVPYVDETTVAAGKAKLRFVHASPGTPAVDVGVGGGVLFTPLFSNVAYQATATGNNGYLEVAPVTSAELSARPHGGADVLSIEGATLPAGAIATAFAIGTIGDAAKPLAVLLCVDNAAPGGGLSSCSTVGAAPKRAHVRIAHLSPDAPAVDACIAPAGTGAFAGPLLSSLGAATGLVYPQVTTYVDLPVGSYDVRVVAPGAGCGTSLVPDTTGVAVTDGLTATIAATGVVSATGSAAHDPTFALAVFADDTSVTSGKAKLRFVHASPGTPAVDVGLGSGQSFTRVFGNVAFRHTASGTGIDANGYVETAPVTSAVSARLTGGTSDALVVPSVTLAAGSISTAFAIGGKTGASTNPLRVLLCGDNATPSGLLTACTVAP